MLLFTLIPAGFVGYLPADVVRAPSATLILGLACAAIVYCIAAACSNEACALTRREVASSWTVEGAAAHVSVLTGAMNNIPRTFAELGARQDNVARLRKAGVPVAIIGRLEQRYKSLPPNYRRP